ncbi:histidine kinase/DNA gyrase B/HSP90-like ATPase [Lutibacter sp. Hel_I_33_5]|uniref:sensor histidine kinase n=1 Tax=Lutibacter sp. Hel_I_33_5 TaxID=1566289 RepID=UPI00119F5B48|nr:HAMP domain-containing sensor histidine kinase [Lutibacter sp. Hel_I_33_5]TVZ56052.1 histidine kinase/DNA gyrase B/HSP90-like ATPase [Lutibacter sp. Hel_I_33_5]
MSFFKNTLWLKRISILTSFLIVSLILWNTYVFFQKFKKAERAKMELHGDAIKEFNTTTIAELDENMSPLPSKIIEKNKDVPMILVDFDGKIKNWNNLDIKRELDIKIEKDSIYLEKQLAIMKSQNEPIKVEYLGKADYIYYKDSDLLDKLTYYPLALLLILVLFLAVIYLFFNSNKVAEQNKLWTGMAKETAHQIGTPLSSLLGWIAILKTENVNDKYVDEIEKDVHRLNTIANRFSKIGSLPELKKTEIVKETKAAFDYLQSRSSKQISFSFSSSNNELFANLNTELYSWVIENLIKNAIDAMLGKGTLEVAISDTNKKIKITVSDTGKGMSKSMYKKIFKPGFTTKKRGWGLGLSLSKRIIEDYHNGKIFVKKSELGKGTTFEVQLLKN